jgi:hypothetical protein
MFIDRVRECKFSSSAESPSNSLLPRSFSTAKQVKWLKERQIPKVGFLFLSKQIDLRLTRQIFEYTCAPDPGAHDALKFVLVARRSWTQEIKIREKILFFLTKKHTPA